jgi:Protein of unknown function (DUF3907)
VYELANTMVKSQVEDVKDFLTTTVSTFEEYLNTKTLSLLQEEEQGDEDYYKSILSNIRRLLVYCEEGLETCKIILQTETFPKSAAEKTLYRIYHQCVEEFFQPKSDAWYEDSRAAYTGRNSIKFHEKAPASVIDLLKGLEANFQRIREELEYYETDYRTKMIQSK